MPCPVRQRLNQDRLLGRDGAGAGLLADEEDGERVVAVDADRVDAVAWAAGGDAVAGVLLGRRG